MKTKILFIERKFWEFVSIEKVFRQIAQALSKEKFESSFQQLAFGNQLTGVFKNLLMFRAQTADIYHITGHVHYIALVLPKEKTVLTVHDLGFLNTRKGLRRIVLKKLLLDMPVKRLKYITAISEATKREIINYTNCSEEKIRVIENPLQEIFFSEAKKTFNRKCPTILQIGTSPNKNLKNLIKALQGLNCRLKIIGKLEADLIEELKKNQIDYQNAFNLNDSEIKIEYEKADILAFCSTFEGFGLPIIEAQAMRTPVVTSNISPLREVSGDAAFLVNPSDFLNIREGILKIVNDEKYREEIIEKGIRNINRFKSRKIAGLYENLYKEVSKANKAS
ncbi:MAG TPA: glycosyltransferase family 1 protein [Pyrinomonadaceae bacterium]|jgi:glycosyltransferase involved in cell wall biosynthesis